MLRGGVISHEAVRIGNRSRNTVLGPRGRAALSEKARGIFFHFFIFMGVGKGGHFFQPPDAHNTLHPNQNAVYLGCFLLKSSYSCGNQNVGVCCKRRILTVPYSLVYASAEYDSEHAFVWKE
jgi:hypothetical protein